MFGAEPVVGGYWRVAYAIDGVVLEDYWRYLGRRWRFDLAQSNPGTVTFYRRSTAGYLAVVNCNEAT